MLNIFAMSLFVSPRDIACRISSCRDVNFGAGGSAASSFLTAGDIARAPEATDRIAVVGRFHKSAGGPCVDRACNLVRSSERSEYDDFRVRDGCVYRRRRLHAVLARHYDVHDDHVRGELLCARDRLVAVLCLPDDLNPAFRAEKGAEAVPDYRMVVRDEHPDVLHSGLSSSSPSIATVTSTRVPRPGELSMEIDPPNVSTRSRIP